MTDSSNDKGNTKVSNRVRRRQQKLKREAERKATLPQPPPVQQPAMPKVDKVAMGVRVALVDQLQAAQRKRAMKESRSKETE